MNDTMSETSPEVGANPGLPPENPEPAPVEPVKAWVVGYGQLGLVNVVASSQEELVERINILRRTTGLSFLAKGSNPLKPFEVLSNNPEEPDKTTIWLNPLLIEAVLDEFNPRSAGAAESSFPPGLAAVLAQMKPSDPEGGEDVAEVVVGLDAPEPNKAND